MKNFPGLMAKDIFGCLTSEEQEELNRIRREKGISDEQYAAMKQQVVSGELHERIETYRHRKRRTLQIMRYAALFILPLSLATYLLLRPADKNTSPVLETQQQSALLQVPQHKQPELILANGQVIKLQREENREIVAPNIVNTGNALEYRKESDNSEEVVPEYNSISVPAAGEFRIILSDGTQVWLNEETRLKYPVEFVNETREIELLEGEIYLEVTKDRQHPFIVHTPKGKVEVLGTHFNVRCQNGNRMETTLAEGKVKVVNGQNNVILSPGQQAIVTEDIQVAEVNINEVICWKDNQFYFDDAPLETILEKLAGWYDFEIFWQNPELKEKKYFMNIDKYTSVEEILKKLSEASNVKFNINGKVVNVCE